MSGSAEVIIFVFDTASLLAFPEPTGIDQEAYGSRITDLC